MKNFRITLLAIVSAAAFTACDDAIDITQPSELLPQDTFETVTDLDTGLNGVYGRIPGENAIYFTSLFTDEVALGIANGGQGTDGELGFLLNASSSDANSIWVTNYGTINLANRLIAGAENVPVEAGSDDETEKNNILAQARAIRAFSHFQLLTYFSPNLKDDSALGVIALDFVPASSAQLPRNTNAEVFALIESDLAYAEENIVDVAFLERKRVGLNFITALRARMAAYRGNYQLAKQYVDQLDALFGLSNKATYKNLWLDNITGAANSATGVDTAPWAGNESIFQLERANTGSTGNFYQYWASVNSTVTGSPFFEVNRALFNLVNNDNDVRKFIVVDATAVIMDNYDDPAVSAADYKAGDILPVGKYTATESQNLLADVKIFRFSEMAFIRAEYYASVGDITNAVAQINNVRRARYNSTTAASGSLLSAPATVQGVWAMIMDERRAELSFEGHRYIDIKRLGTLAGKGVERDPRDCAWNNLCTLPADDYRFTLPIPSQELTANPNIQQNPNY